MIKKQYYGKLILILYRLIGSSIILVGIYNVLFGIYNINPIEYGKLFRDRTLYQEEFFKRSVQYGKWYQTYGEEFFNCSNEIVSRKYPDYLDSNFVDDSNMLSLTLGRISKKTRSWFESNKATNCHILKDVSLVISHCDKSVGWIFEYFIPKGFEFQNITIYSKCGQDEVVGAPINNKTTIVRLPNVGRCDHTYAHHLNQLDVTKLSKDHIVLFLKDNNYQVTGETMDMMEMLQTAYINGFACLKLKHPNEKPKIDVCPTYSAYFHTSSLRTMVMAATYIRETKRDKTKDEDFFSPYEHLGHFVDSLDLTLPGPLVPVCFGGLFAATVSQIEKGKSVWGKLENGLSRGNNIEEGHFVERLWAASLSKRPSASSMLKLVDRMSELIPVNIDTVHVAGSVGLFCPERKQKKRIRPN